MLWLKGVILVVLILAGWHGGGCAVASQREGPGVAVRRVDYGGAPELAGLAEEARGFANAMYPRVCALFLDGEAEAPRHFDLILRPIPGGNQGEAHIHRGSIHLDSVSLTNGPLQAERLRHLLVHEMAHLATVRSPGWRRWWSSPDPDARAWQESLAEFACFKLLEGVGPGCAQCDARLPTYADGYECGGAFLLFLDGRHGTNFVRLLVGALRRKSFDPGFFLRATYHYAVHRTSVEAAWVLERAWRTDPEGKVVEEYSCR